MAKKPSYIGLLNAVANGERGGYELFKAWHDSTKDEALKPILDMVAVREMEHSWAFEKRLTELGYGLRPTTSKALKKQVRFLLGTPLVSEPFHANRWDYFYSLYSHDQKLSERYQISVIFSEKGVSKIVRGQLPSNPTVAPKTEPDKPGLLGRLLKTVNPFN